MVPQTQEGEKIVLAGTEWVIPPLRAKQMVKVVPVLMSLAADMAGGEMRMIRSKHPKTGAEVLIPAFTEVQMLDILHATYNALSRNYPGLTVDIFDDMAITSVELFNALPALNRASGLKPAAEEEESETPLGEAGAQPSPTGQT
jgi:hypothetical protein